jgi:hypothetical protein
MTAYQNCKVSDVMPVTLPSGVAGRTTASASAARTSDLSSRCRSRRGKTPNRREPRSRVPSKRLLRSRRRVRRSRAYARSDMLERRRPLMESWSRYVGGEADGTVVPLKRAEA